VDICIQLSIASSQGPPHLPPLPSKRGLVLTVSAREEHSVIFSGKSFTHLPCLYREDYTNQKYRSLFEKVTSGNESCWNTTFQTVPSFGNIQTERQFAVILRVHKTWDNTHMHKQCASGFSSVLIGVGGGGPGEEANYSTKLISYLLQY